MENQDQDYELSLNKSIIRSMETNMCEFDVRPYMDKNLEILDKVQELSFEAAEHDCEFTTEYLRNTLPQDDLVLNATIAKDTIRYMIDKKCRLYNLNNPNDNLSDYEIFNLYDHIWGMNNFFIKFIKKSFEDFLSFLVETNIGIDNFTDLQYINYKTKEPINTLRYIEIYEEFKALIFKEVFTKGTLASKKVIGDIIDEEDLSDYIIYSLAEGKYKYIELPIIDPKNPTDDSREVDFVTYEEAKKFNKVPSYSNSIVLGPLTFFKNFALTIIKMYKLNKLILTNSDIIISEGDNWKDNLDYLDLFKLYFTNITPNNVPYLILQLTEVIDLNLIFEDLPNIRKTLETIIEEYGNGSGLLSDKTKIEDEPSIESEE